MITLNTAVRCTVALLYTPYTLTSAYPGRLPEPPLGHMDLAVNDRSSPAPMVVGVAYEACFGITMMVRVSHGEQYVLYTATMSLEQGYLPILRRCAAP